MAFYLSIDLLIDAGYFHFDYWKDDMLTWVLAENLNLEYAAHVYSPRRELQDLNLCYFSVPKCFACIYVCAEPSETEDSIGSPGTRATDSCQPPCRPWKANLCPLQE